MDVNLNQLRCFYMAAKYQSVTVAAEKLFVSPPAVTAQIKRLESMLGFKLLNRGYKKVTISKDAREMYRHADAIFSKVELFERYMDTFVGTKEGEVLVGAHQLVALHILPNVLEQFEQDLPHLNFKIILSKSSELVDKLLKQDVQIFVTLSDPHHKNIKTKPLFSEDIILVAASNSSHAKGGKCYLSDLNNTPMLTQEHDTRFYRIMSSFLEGVGVTPEIVMDNLSGDVITRFVAKDVGMALVPRFVAQDEIEKGVIREIELVERLPVMQVGIAYMVDHRGPAHLQSFLSYLEETRFSRSILEK